MKLISSNWQDKASVKKGNIGEGIIRQFLEEKGYIVYEPVTRGPHGFDKLAVRNKKDVLIAECKTKAKRTYYDDTGIDLRHYKEYKYVYEKHQIDVFLFFVDEHLAEVYGHFLRVLEKPNGSYPLIQNNIIYFPMANMCRNICKLTPEQVESLKVYSKRNYSYER